MDDWKEKMWANLYCQQTAQVGSRHIYHWLVDTAIGQIHITQWEEPGLELKEKIFFNDNDGAERLFARKVSAIAAGRA